MLHAILSLTTIFVALSLVFLTLRTIFASTPYDWWQAYQHHRAGQRALALLRVLLRPNEYQQIKRFGYLDVPSPSRCDLVYRIPLKGGLVRVYDRGSAVKELCLQPLEPLPLGDVVVIHKLMIESSEDEYLRVANHFAPGLLSMQSIDLGMEI